MMFTRWPVQSMMIGQILIACLLIPCDVVISTSNQPAKVELTSDTESLEKICNGTSEPLTSISHVRSLIKHLGEQSVLVRSCQNFANAFKNLEPILEDAQSGKICNLRLIKKIRNYHNKFIYTYNESNENPEIPVVLRRFFMSLCFQIDAECKMSFINNLETDTKKHITEEDYYSIKVLEDYGVTLLGSDEPIGDFDDIVLVKDLKSEEEEVGLDLVLKVRTTELMLKLVRSCREKFKPIYDKLIMPLIELSNLGYDYQGEILVRELIELKQNKLAIRWYNIVQACETFGSFTIYEDPKVQLVGDSRMITFIDSVEAEKLREQRVETLTEKVEASGELKPIEYEPIASHETDTLWILEQEELDKLIARLKTSSSEDSRIKKRLLKKFLSKIYTTIKSGKVFAFAKDILGSSMRRAEDETPVQDINQELINVFNAAVVEVENLDNNVKPLAGSNGSYYKNSYMPRKAVGRGKIPPKISYIASPKDASSMGTKLYEGIFSRFVFKKRNVFFTLIAIIGILLLFVAVAMNG